MPLPFQGRRRQSIVLLAGFIFGVVLTNALFHITDLHNFDTVPTDSNNNNRPLIPPILPSSEGSFSSSGSAKTTGNFNDKGGVDRQRVHQHQPVVGVLSKGQSDEHLPNHGEGIQDDPFKGCPFKLDASLTGLRDPETGIVHAEPLTTLANDNAEEIGGEKGKQVGKENIKSVDSESADVNTIQSKSWCHGARPVPSCITPETVDFLRRHVRIGIATGKEGTFRVEVSQCTWLSHYPPEIVYAFTDVAPRVPQTPHHWVGLGVPKGITQKNCDLFSEKIPWGYQYFVQKKLRQGYKVPWIKAQFRFPMGLQYMWTRHHDEDIKWWIFIDDDTILQPQRLVERLQTLDPDKALYLNEHGWGGAGHFFSRRAMEMLMGGLDDCIERWMVKHFKASDTMLLKCAELLKIPMSSPDWITACPPSKVKDKLLDPKLLSLHSKKDFSPYNGSTRITVWRTALTYLAMFCQSSQAKDAAVSASPCTFGAHCKSSGCDKQEDRQKVLRWEKLSPNGSTAPLPLGPYYQSVAHRHHQ